MSMDEIEHCRQQKTRKALSCAGYLDFIGLRWTCLEGGVVADGLEVGPVTRTS